MSRLKSTSALAHWNAAGLLGPVLDTDEVSREMADALAAALDHPEVGATELRFDARP